MTALILAACGGGAGRQAEPEAPADTAVAAGVPSSTAARQTVAAPPEPAPTAEAQPEVSVSSAEETPEDEAVAAALPSSTAAAASTAPETTAVAAAPDTTAAPPAPVFEGPPAPAVVLSLDDGSTYASADAARPALFVFWAEW